MRACARVGVCACTVTQDYKQSEDLKAGTQRAGSGSEGTDGGSCRCRGAGLGVSLSWPGAARRQQSEGGGMGGGEVGRGLGSDL